MLHKQLYILALLSALQAGNAIQQEDAILGCPPVQPHEDIVQLPRLGRIRGRVECQHIAFLGLPYALPPVGGLRWRPPVQLPESTFDEMNATAFGPSCIQLRTRPLSQVGAMLLGLGEESEDCLRLNVFFPRRLVSDGRLMDVVVFIHGGTFSTGGSAAPIYNPKDLLEHWQDVVFVSFDYRLGVFGWAGSRDLAEDDGSIPVGNYGLLDQRAALLWVQENIKAFGGDPGRVTVMGHSAGAMSASWLQLLFPELAKRWILLSGTALSWHERRVDGELEGKIWERLAEGVNCDPRDAPCMRRVGAAELNAIAQSLRTDYLWGPMIDNRLISSPARELLHARNTRSNIGDTLISVVKDEGSLFVNEKVLSAQDYEAMIRSFFPPNLANLVLARYPVAAYPSAFAAANAVITDGVFACPAVRLYNFLAFHLASGHAHLVQMDHALLVPSMATLFAQGRDYGVFHGSELVLLFNFSPFITLPNWEQQKELRNGIRRFMSTGSPMAEGQMGFTSMWKPPTALLRATQCQAVWGLLEGRPALPANFRSIL